MLRFLKELYQYRALLWSLTQRELKARYRGSALGFLWTFLNPMLLMLVYALVFSVYMRQQIEHYTYFMFVGLLPWIFFSTSVVGGASAISDRRDLLTKVRFPAQVLPSTVVAVNLVNYLLSLPLMFGMALAFGRPLSWHVILLPLVLAVQIVLTMALVYGISALNVGFRDLQHIVGNLMTLGLFLTPVLYTANAIPERYRNLVVKSNPMAVIVTSYQAIFYERRLPDFGALAMTLLLSITLLWLTATLFEGKQEEFAETI